MNSPVIRAPGASALKFTAYFPERERAGTRFLAEEMFDLFAQRRIATSVMLRGICSFGHRRIIRTDESLTLSEDPAVAITAVDSPTVIRAITDEALAMAASGLYTVERASLLDAGRGATATVELPEGDAVKLTIYVGRNRRSGGVPVYRAVCDLLHRNGFHGATVLLGVDGTSRGERRRAHFVGRNVDVPAMIIAVGDAEQARRSVPALAAALDRPLMTLERVRVCKHDGRRLAAPPALPATDRNGLPLWQKLMVFTSESDLHDGVPIHRALVRRLWESGTASGATVLRGVWGYHGSAQPHGDRLFQLSRHVPVVSVAVDSPDRIAASFGIIDELTADRGLVTCEMVPALLALDAGERRGGTELADCRY